MGFRSWTGQHDKAKEQQNDTETGMDEQTQANSISDSIATPRSFCKNCIRPPPRVRIVVARQADGKNFLP